MGIYTNMYIYSSREWAFSVTQRLRGKNAVVHGTAWRQGARGKSEGPIKKIWI